MNSSELHHFIADLDRRYNTNIARHKDKVAAIPEALNSDEEVRFVMSGSLRGSFRDDVFVATNKRLLVIRRNGKQVDDYDLAETIEICLPSKPSDYTNPQHLVNLDITFPNGDCRVLAKSAPVIALAASVYQSAVGIINMG
ncbi:MAG: hypothetical protein OXG27_15450 [Chloroflexi bacterium]|nr:hypothetical protein [Chloroflexota bacterium]